MGNHTRNLGPVQPEPDPTPGTSHPYRNQRQPGALNPGNRNSRPQYGDPVPRQRTQPRPVTAPFPPRDQRRKARRAFLVLIGVLAGTLAAVCVLGGIVATMTGDPAGSPDPRMGEVTALPPKGATSAPVANGDPVKAPPSATAPSKAATATGGITAEGTLLVPKEVKPGTYRATVPGDSFNCYWARLSGPSNEFGNIIGNGNAAAGAKVTVTIKSTDKAFHSEGCGAWVKVS